MSPSRRGRGPLMAVLAGVLALHLAPAAARAEGPAPDTSLKLVPASASFYQSLLRNREQIEVVARSRAWARLMELPSIKMGLQAVRSQLAKPEGDLARLLELYEQPENRELVELLTDAVSQEVFFYGGESMSDLLELAAVLQGAQQFGPLMMLASGQARPDNINELRKQALLTALAENKDQIRTPELVVGFRVSKPARAEAQLKRLQTVLEEQVARVPALKGRLERSAVGTASYLTLKLDGSMVPWEKLFADADEDDAAELKAVAEKLKKMKLTVSLGLRGNYLLLAVAESTALLGDLDRTGPRIGDLAELKPLAKHADRPLTSITYVSKSLVEKISTTAKDLEEIANLVKQGLDQAKLPEERRKRIDADLAALVKLLEKQLPVPGAQMAFTFLTERGQEGYTYNYGQTPGLDGSKPLTLLEHVGGSPILAVVGRSSFSPETYKTAVSWLKKIYGHLEENALEHLEDGQKQIYQQVTQVVFPILQRLDRATGDLLLPSLADGQSAFVLDGKWSSNQWVQALPRTEKALPMLELGLVLGVSDAALFRKAFAEYRSVLNDAIARGREMVPVPNVPEFKIPDPEARKIKAGTLYYYPVPEIAGLEEQFVPTAGLSNRVAAFTLSRSHAERLLTATPLEVSGGPLANTKRNLAGAVYFDWPALLDTARPWIDFGLDQALKAKAADGEDDAPAVKQADAIARQAREVIGPLFDLLRVFRGYTSVSYFEGAVLVTHGETVLKDLK